MELREKERKILEFCREPKSSRKILDFVGKTAVSALQMLIFITVELQIQQDGVRSPFAPVG
jgi:hypothetical protein